MESKSNKFAKKCMRKQKRAQHRLVRDTNIECTDEPTQHLAICNAGLVTGLKREILKQFIEELISDHRIIMPPGKSYCFINFNSIDDSIKFYDKVHGNLRIPEQNTYFYLTYVKSIPYQDETKNNQLPPGLRLLTDFVSSEEESLLLQSIDWEDEAESAESKLKHRKVKHFGYKFRYDDNLVDVDNPVTPIPQKYEFLQKLFDQHGCGNFVYDQLTVNRYLPGQGIPPHIDTHSVFEDPILSLSLGSAYVMDFKREDRKIELDLPPRSLLVMSGETRYAWNHGICPRHNDNVDTNDGFSTRPRGVRVSFTFRKIHRGDCICEFDEFCDSKRSAPKETRINESIASRLENSYVHEVYEEISSHFNETRHKQWPNVAKFIERVEIGGLLLDVGCGNGKYLLEHSNVFKMGCDLCSGLARICRSRGFEVSLADSLQLPYKSNTFDAVLCIAVVHHFSTDERRKRAISEIVRVLGIGGKALVYVWAKEQSKDSTDSAYLKLDTSRGRREGKINAKNARNTRQRRLDAVEGKVNLPVHENRTEFLHSDTLVPWKRKDGGEFLRYYHVFREGELEKLCSEVPSSRVRDAYYDQGNWCVALEKL